LPSSVTGSCSLVDYGSRCPELTLSANCSSANEALKGTNWPASATGEFAKISAAYGLRLFRIVEQGWRVLLAGHRAETTGRLDEAELEAALAGYDSAWTEYRALAASPLCPSLYEGRYFGLPGKTAELGLDASVAHFRKLLFAPALK